MLKWLFLKLTKKYIYQDNVVYVVKQLQASRRRVPALWE